MRCSSPTLSELHEPDDNKRRESSMRNNHRKHLRAWLEICGGILLGVVILAAAVRLTLIVILPGIREISEQMQSVDVYKALNVLMLSILIVAFVAGILANLFSNKIERARELLHEQGLLRESVADRMKETIPK